MLQLISVDYLMLKINLKEILSAIVGIYRTRYTTQLCGRANSINLLSQFKHSILYLYEFIIMMELQQDNEKIKYWQYKLSKKQKTKPIKQEFKNKIGKTKTPQKRKKIASSNIMPDNFFSQTLDKLKLLLEQSSTKKHTDTATAHMKRSKENTITKNTLRPVNEPLKKTKKVEPNRIIKSISTNQVRKPSKKINQEDKSRLQKQSPKKSKSRSKSKKHKTQKSKQFQKSNSPKISPPHKPTKKKQKQKISKPKGQTIQLSVFSEEDPIWSKVNMQTMLVHETSDDNQIQFPGQSINFKQWQLQQQKMFEIKKKQGCVINKYLSGFLIFVNFDHNSKQGKMGQSQTNKLDSSSFNLQFMIRNQQSKLMELKQYLNKLKDSQNLNQNLELIISKVNQNIQGLKHYQIQSNQIQSNQIQSNQIQSNQIQSNQIQSNQVQNNPQNQNSLNSSRIKEIHNLQIQHQKQLISFHADSKSQDSNQPIMLEYLSPVHQNTNLNKTQNISDSLTISNYQPSNINNLNEEELSHLIDRQIEMMKEQSSMLLLNSKFDQTSLLSNKREVKQSKQEKQKNTEVNLDIMLQNKSEMLLSDQKSDVQLLSPDFNKYLPLSPTHHSFIPSRPKNYEEMPFRNIKKQPFLSKIKTIQSDQQPPSPLQTISINNTNSENNKLLHESLQRILNQQAIKIQQPSQQTSEHTKHTICDAIFSQLIIDFIDFFSTHQSALQQLFSKYNNDVVEVQEDNQKIIDQFFDDSLEPIQSTDSYLLQLAKNVIMVAQELGFQEKLIKPLGVTTQVTLRCMRQLQYDENQDENQIDEDMQELGRYIQILDHQHYQIFQSRCSCRPDQPYQLILNRCIYDSLNLILDNLRPYGSKGRPAFCFRQKLSQVPPMHKIQNYVKIELQKLIGIKIGLINDSNMEQHELRQTINGAMVRYNNNLVEEIQKEYGQATDDGLQIYELMLIIEEEIFEQQIMQLAKLQCSLRFDRK